MPRSASKLDHQATLPWGPADKVPDGPAVWRTATQEQQRAFDAVWVPRQVERLKRLGFSGRLIGTTRLVAFARFLGWDRVRVNRRVFPLTESAWPRMEG